MKFYRSFIIATAISLLPAFASASENDVIYSIDPADGSEVDAVETIRISFEDATYVSMKMDDDDLVSDYNGETVIPQTSSAEAWKGVFIFNFKEALSDAGTYELVCPAGCFEVEKTDGSTVLSPEIHYTLTVLGRINHTVEYTSIPAVNNYADPVKEFSDVEFFFNEDATITLGDKSDELFAMVDYDVYPSPKVDPENVTRLYYENPVRDTSPIFIYFPEGFWNITFEDGNTLPSPRIDAYFYIDSSLSGYNSMILEEDETAEIYDLSGTCVTKNKSLRTLQNLPAGIYIINGKTIIVR